MRKAILAALTVWAAAGCGGPRGLEPKTPDPRWAGFVKSHPAGRVPRRGRLKIDFLVDLFPEAEIGSDAGRYLSFVPGLPGDARIAGPRRIVITPRDGLKRGRRFLGRLRASALAGLPAGIGDFEFAFEVMPQAFDLRVGHLVSRGSAAGMELAGTVATADAEDAESVRKLVRASLDGVPLATEWTHAPSGRNHSFLVKGIRRAEDADRILIVWDGSALGLAEKGRRQVEVPALEVFKAVDAGLSGDGPQSLVVYFTDPLDPEQDLRGLVAVNHQGFSTRIEGNMLKIFPSRSFVGKVSVTIRPGLRNRAGRPLEKEFSRTIAIASRKPGVRFTGKGVILPAGEVLSIPFEGINVHSVQVTAFRVPAGNVAQFLQTNTLGGTAELARVGRYAWRKTISLPPAPPDEWTRYDLDAGELFAGGPGGIVRLSLSINRGNSVFACSEEESAVPAGKEPPFEDHEDLHVRRRSGWDWYENTLGGSGRGTDWRDREDPCKDAYYKYAPAAGDSRNFLSSDFGLIAKRDGNGRLTVAVASLRTAEPLKGVAVSVRNFQDIEMARGTTGRDGLASFDGLGTPFYLVASRTGQTGYLKLSAGTRRPDSHFDVGGAQLDRGVKGTLYGERGVWRPGDEVHLVFVLEDKDGKIPDNHPAALRLLDPKGRTAATRTNAAPVGGFYRFSIRTPEDAPTGTWTAEARLGGRVFRHPVRIETVRPNRLKIDLDLGTELRAQDGAVAGSLAAEWLHGAPAGGLAADVSLRLAPAPAAFGRSADHVFTDPSRRAPTEAQTVFDGRLDAAGKASFSAVPSGASSAPGPMRARFTTRVFEEGGGFSTGRRDAVYHPFPVYVGVKLPEGDSARGMLLTDSTHTVSIAALDPGGAPLDLDGIEVSVYKLSWKWWWDKSEDALPDFSSARHAARVSFQTVDAKAGRSAAAFEIKAPQWGRYFLRACDPKGGHCSGKIFYVDWPGWAGQAAEQTGPGASVLDLRADKPSYAPGETARLRLPEAARGRALLTIETGRGIVESRWLSLGPKAGPVPVRVTEAMAPNAYASVTMIQPHHGKSNDRPIRLYGTVPIIVSDPATRLEPVLETAEEWAPLSTGTVRISEARGRAMTYTLAVVDEGLLGLTGFKTPDLHAHFYRKEALGVATWDLYDEVVGAYGGRLERLLALGGDAALEGAETAERKRFPPVVRFFGPFTLEKGESAVHEVPLPLYVGAVRVMAVAGRRGAYGKAERGVFVRQPLTVLAGLPRTLGPGEETTLSAAVFSSALAGHPLTPKKPGRTGLPPRQTLREALVTVDPGDFFEVVGETAARVSFAGTGEVLVRFRVKAKARVGTGRIVVRARGGGLSAEAVADLPVRVSNPPTVRRWTRRLAPGERWETKIVPHGLGGTRRISLELSSIPPLNLENRLDYLIRYPYGCIEQTTSGAFSQLHLPDIVSLSGERRSEIEKNVRAGLERLRLFQRPDGGFQYWPGQEGPSHPWATSYAGHFLVDADRLGYPVPEDLKSEWLRYQKRTAQSWSPGGPAADIEQSYRLYTLALAGEPELGAMNRLRERGELPSVVAWQLAAAYTLAGLPGPAGALTARDATLRTFADHHGPTFGSPMRDKALMLASAADMKRYELAGDLPRDISRRLDSERGGTTHETGLMLVSMSRFYGRGGTGPGFGFTYAVGGRGGPVVSPSRVHILPLDDFPDAGETLSVLNTSSGTVFASAVSRGVPEPGSETSLASGLSLEVAYAGPKGEPVDAAGLPLGSDINARITVRNTSGRRLENIALAHIVPSGWEIANARLDGSAADAAPGVEYEDIRDDRIYSHFALDAGAAITIASRLNAAYAGRYYLPAIVAEAMYEPETRALIKGRWVTVDER